jgi:predicted O-methyltransferase YrrM
VAALKDSLQDPAELSAFIDLLKREGVRSYLEVGANAGGTFRKIGSALERPSTLVAIDLGGKSPGRIAARRALKQAVADLKGIGQVASVIFGDSRDGYVIDRANGFAPFDCVLIDGDHSADGVKADFENYAPMARMVAFHDIAWRRAAEWGEGQRIAVPGFWNAIKGGYRHEEIKLCPTGKNNGIGVLWRS